MFDRVDVRVLRGRRARNRDERFARRVGEHVQVKEAFAVFHSVIPSGVHRVCTNRPVLVARARLSSMRRKRSTCMPVLARPKAVPGDGSYAHISPDDPENVLQEASHNWGTKGAVCLGSRLLPDQSEAARVLLSPGLVM